MRSHSHVGRTGVPHTETSSSSVAVRADAALERDADHIANAVVQHGGITPATLSRSAGRVPSEAIQSKCADCEADEHAPARAKPAPSLLADDEGEVAAGQMRKGDFLAALRAEICVSVDEAMSGTGRDSRGCPWIDHWLGYYGGRSASQVEQALRRFAPEAAHVATARDYIPLVAARVGRSADTYASTGEIVGVPDDVPMGGMAGGILSAFGGMFFKARPGGANAAPTPQAVRSQLGAGRPLHGPVRSRMESAFGTSFARVRLHTDGTAARMSHQLNARAFAVGEHVAFGNGEYQPGTLVGDALIAHELAHVVQQGGAETAGADIHSKSVPATTAIERDADTAAIGVAATLWGRTRQAVAGMPRLRSGLSLSRCSSKAPSRERKPIVLADCPAVSEADWRASVSNARTDEEKIALVQSRLCKSTVALAGNKCASQEHPDDLQAVPTINFDPLLNQKRRFSHDRNCDGTRKREPGAGSGSGKPEMLRDNAGHAFRAQKTKYVVLGPKVLEKGPWEPKRTAEHELYHAEHHLESSDETHEHELEAYVQDFKKYFTLMGSMKRGPHDAATNTQPDIYFGSSWMELARAYAAADAKRRPLYLDDLMEFYKESPPPTQLLFREWLKRRDSDVELVKDLNSGLKLP